MDKDEILQRSREQKEDEGSVFAENKGRHFGVVGFCVVYFILMFFNIIMKQDNYIPHSMFFAYMAAEAYGRFRITRKKTLMVTTVLAGIASILSLVCHILSVLGIGA